MLMLYNERLDFYRVSRSIAQDFWFSNLKAQLTENVVTNLQNQIDEIRGFVEISDEIYEKYGESESDGLNGMFTAISNIFYMIQHNVALLNITVKSDTGLPIPDITFANVTDEKGKPVATNKNGKVSGFCTEGEVTLSISGYADLSEYTKTINLVKGNVYAVNCAVPLRNFYAVSSSQDIMYSSICTRVDFTICGGGGAGGDGATASSLDLATYGGAGGGGGYVVEAVNVPFTPNTPYALNVGAGGSPTSITSTMQGNGNNGGATSFMGYNASGGSGGQKYGSSTTYGGSGNGKGGNGTPTNGGAGTQNYYASFTTLTGAGGGGGGAPGTKNSSSRGYGSTNGGNGGYGKRVGNPGSATSGRAPGGGGGGAEFASSGAFSSAASGGAGGLAIRLYH